MGEVAVISFGNMSGLSADSMIEAAVLTDNANMALQSRQPTEQRDQGGSSFVTTDYKALDTVLFFSIRPGNVVGKIPAPAKDIGLSMSAQPMY
jgi:hypothetical protein